jgi:hypothetical protein
MKKRYDISEIRKYNIEAENFLNSFSNITEMLMKIQLLAKTGFSWKPDPLGGFYDYYPVELWMFFARKGDDCDGWAELAFQSSVRLGLDSDLYIVADLRNPWASSHEIVITKEGGYYYLISNWDYFKCEKKKDCFNILKNNKIVSYGKYNRLLKTRRAKYRH